MQTTKMEKLEQLRRDILGVQVARTEEEIGVARQGLGPLAAAFPVGSFPGGAVHELVSNRPEGAAATAGFMAALLSFLMKPEQPGGGKACLWAGARRCIFPPALWQMGVAADRIIFIEEPKERELFWTIEEALRCDALAAVVGEVRGLDFKQSRRLQLAVERSNVTGFIHHLLPGQLGPTACVTRWHVAPLASQLEQGMPGVGLPRWQVELLKVRGGSPAVWFLEWAGGHFRSVDGRLERPRKASMETKIGVA